MKKNHMDGEEPSRKPASVERFGLFAQQDYDLRPLPLDELRTYRAGPSDRTQVKVTRKDSSTNK